MLRPEAIAELGRSLTAMRGPELSDAAVALTDAAYVLEAKADAPVAAKQVIDLLRKTAPRLRARLVEVAGEIRAARAVLQPTPKAEQPVVSDVPVVAVHAFQAQIHAGAARSSRRRQGDQALSSKSRANSASVRKPSSMRSDATQSRTRSGSTDSAASRLRKASSRRSQAAYRAAR